VAVAPFGGLNVDAKAGGIFSVGAFIVLCTTTTLMKFPMTVKIILPQNKSICGNVVLFSS